MKTIKLESLPQGLPRSPEEFLSLLLQAQEEPLLFTLADGRSFMLQFVPPTPLPSPEAPSTIESTPQIEILPSKEEDSGEETSQEEASQEAEAEDDFATEIEAQRNNPELMAFLDEEGRQPQRTVSLAEAKAILGLP